MKKTAAPCGRPFFFSLEREKQRTFTSRFSPAGSVGAGRSPPGSSTARPSLARCGPQACRREEGSRLPGIFSWQRPRLCKTGKLCARGFPLAAAWVFPVRRRDLQTKRIIDIFYRNAIIIIEREPAGENARVDCVKHNILVKFRKSETCGWPRLTIYLQKVAANLWRGAATFSCF